MMKTPDDHRSHIGKKGEIIAVTFLKNRGFRIINKNYKTPFGEIDIIAKKKHILIFFEVKTRISEKFGAPLEAINNRKKEHIIKNCMYFIRKNNKENVLCRIDAIGIKLNDKNELEFLRHVKNAVQLEYKHI